LQFDLDQKERSEREKYEASKKLDLYQNGLMSNVKSMKWVDDNGVVRRVTLDEYVRLKEEKESELNSGGGDFINADNRGDFDSDEDYFETPSLDYASNVNNRSNSMTINDSSSDEEHTLYNEMHPGKKPKQMKHGNPRKMMENLLIQQFKLAVERKDWDTIDQFMPEPGDHRLSLLEVAAMLVRKPKTDIVKSLNDLGADDDTIGVVLAKSEQLLKQHDIPLWKYDPWQGQANSLGGSSQPNSLSGNNNNTNNKMKKQSSIQSNSKNLHQKSMNMNNSEIFNPSTPTAPVFRFEPVPNYKITLDTKAASTQLRVILLDNKPITLKVNYTLKLRELHDHIRSELPNGSTFDFDIVKAGIGSVLDQFDSTIEELGLRSQQLLIQKIL